MLLGLLAITCLAATQAFAYLILHGALRPTRLVQIGFYGAIAGATIFGGLWMDAA